MSNLFTMWIVCFFTLASSVMAKDMELAREGKTNYTIVVDDGAIAPERHAAEELAKFLKEVTGTSFPIRRAQEKINGPKIIVGTGRLTQDYITPDAFKSLGSDGLVIESHGDDLLLAGGRPRGTLYAVYTFLEDVVGCRWWSSKVSTIPRRPTLIVPQQHLRQVPILEYREPFYYDAFDVDWAVRNKVNGNRAPIDEKRGGHISYKGFVHTFYPLVPPSKYFKEHPEWFSERGGKRNPEHGQLCLTNKALKDFVVQRVREWLTESPNASIVSVSQNDWGGRCQCSKCVELEKSEGSPSGPMLHFVNYIAEKIEKDFPNVAISTLAYHYTRKPPKHVRPRPNVIVRLCSIECSFAHTLGESEVNKSFREDIEGWSKICNRLYIWDYVTNFGHYIQPHPNLRVLGPNIRFFVNHGVKGIFEEGNYQSPGGEFAELRAWVLAKLLWNPKRDDRALIEEFVKGYYGDAAPQISAYIKLIHDEVERTNHYLSIGSPPNAPFLSLNILAKAKELFDAAEKAVADQPDVLNRVQVARMPLRYVWVTRWHSLQQEAATKGIPWPGPKDYVQTAKDFLALAAANKITRISEGRRIDSFEKRTVGLGRKNSPPPPGCANLSPTEYIDLQDATFNLAREGRWATLTSDSAASDGVAARMPGNHYEWAVQQRLSIAPITQNPNTKYRCYVVIKCEVTGKEGLGFTYGLYDTKARKGYSHHRIMAAEIKDSNYHVYELGTFPLNPHEYLWVAPPRNPENVKAVWVDRFFLVKAGAKGK